MKVPRARVFFIGAALSLTAMMLPAYAATLTFDWSATAAGASLGYFPFIGSGTLTATTGSGGDTVTSITGSFTTNGPSPVTDTVTGVGPTTPANNMIYPIGTTFTGPPVVTSGVSYTSVSNLDTHGLAFATTAGTFLIFSSVVPNADPTEATGNYYSQAPAGGGFGVGLFNLTLTPPVGNGNQGDNSQGDNNNSQGADFLGNQSNADPPATPLPATLPLFATGLGALGLLGWRRKRKARVSLLGAA